jgi:hypothetical protein
MLTPSPSIPGNSKSTRQSQIHFPAAYADIGRPGPTEAETSTAALEIKPSRNLILPSTAAQASRQRRQSAEGLRLDRIRSRTLTSAATLDSRHASMNQEKAPSIVTRMSEESVPFAFSDEYDLCESYFLSRVVLNLDPSTPPSAKEGKLLVPKCIGPAIVQ